MLRQSLRFTTPLPLPGDYPVSHGLAGLAMDADHDGGWVLTIDDVLTSYLDLGDLTHLEFEYVRWMGDLLDCLEPPGGALRVVHLGGGACTLPIYVALTHPESRQTVFEYDTDLIALVTRSFGIRSSRRLRLVPTDALAGLRGLPDASADVVVRDAFVASTTPRHLGDDEFMAQVRRVLAPGGLYLANVADKPPLPLTRAHLAAIRSGLLTHTRPDSIALVTEPAVLRGRRFGNVVLAACASGLPVEAWSKATTRAGLPARVVHGERVAQY